MTSQGILVYAFALLLALLSSTNSALGKRSLTQTGVVNYVTGSDPKGAPVSIPALTVWTWCGFNSMEKLTANVTADSEISLYISPKRLVKGAEASEAGLPGYNTCRSTACVRKAGGRFIKFNRCVAVGNFHLTKTLTAKVSVTTAKDSTVTGFIVGIVILCVGVVVCCVLSCFCCLKSVFCCCCP